jgi:pyruvate formate lyase activating enzyme
LRAEPEPARDLHRARGSAAAALRIGGFVPFSATDYPGHLCAVVFCQGCPWRCGYCHNPHLLPLRSPVPAPQWEDVLAFLENRRGLLDAVVFSGGEPTLHAGLADAMKAVRAAGFGIGLHTAGIYPTRLASLLPLVDWVGFDVKASFEDYEDVTRTPHSGARARRSLEILLASGVAHQIRTTVDTRILTPAKLDKLRSDLERYGVAGHVLQTCREVETPAFLNLHQSGA